MVTKGSRHLLASLLVLCSVLIPLPAFAVSAACANFSPASFQGMGGASGAFINYAPGPFLPGDEVTVGVGAVLPAYIPGPYPNDGYSLVDAGGNVLAGPQFDLAATLSFDVKSTTSAIGLKNLGEDFIFVHSASCKAAPFTAEAPAITNFGIFALALLLCFFSSPLNKKLA